MSPLKSEPVLVQFATSLKKIKVAIKKWILVWKTRKQKDVMGIESKLSRLLSNENGESLSSAQMEEIKDIHGC